MKKKCKFGFLWVTFALFAISLAGHWIAGWYEFLDEQKQHQQAVEMAPYIWKMMRGTLENWQSEFLQLCWQVAGLAYLWYVGSPQSKEGDDRKEELLEEILKAINPSQAQSIIQRLEQKYPKH